MLVKVKFHGFLKKLCPDEYKVDARTPYEAIRMVTGQLGDKLKRPNGHRFSVFVKEAKTNAEMDSSLTSDELNVFPAFVPAGGHGSMAGYLLRSLVYMILIVIFALVALLPGMQAVGIGGMLAVGGMWLGDTANVLINHFTKKEKPDQNETQQNYAFGIDGNTTKIGTAIPVGYGRYRVYGHLLSLGSESPNGTKSL